MVSGCIDHLPVLSSHINLVLFDVPLSTSIPASAEGVPSSSLFKTNILSLSVVWVVLIEVVVPLTVRLPSTTILPLAVIVLLELPSSKSPPALFI